MPRKISIEPIYALADAIDAHPFDARVLPLRVIPNVAIEDIIGLFDDATFAWLENEIGRRDLQAMRDVRYAIVHRYETIEEHQGNQDHESAVLLNNLAAFLQLIRPMRQRANLIQGTLTERNTLNAQNVVHPIDLMEVPEVQKLFHLSNADAEFFCEHAARFLTVITGEYWKIRMAVEFFRTGHFEENHWKARFSLWCAALEALFTSPSSPHNGRLVATERVKSFIGSDTNIYDRGDLPAFVEQTQISVSDALTDIYKIRNFVVHGEKVPDRYFEERRQGVGGFVNRVQVALEALSSIVRKSILKIFRDHIEDVFQSNETVNAHFETLNLTRPHLLRRNHVLTVLKEAGVPMRTPEITAALNLKLRQRVARLDTQGEVDQALVLAVQQASVRDLGDGTFEVIP
jgi:hypothetical protein